MSNDFEFFWQNRPASTKQALHDVMAERHRQMMAEGWTAKHDDEHDKGEMARAAGCYAIIAGSCQGWPLDSYKYVAPPATVENGDGIDIFWPWSPKWWKPKSPRRDLVRAAALLLAEIERMDRAVSKDHP